MTKTFPFLSFSIPVFFVAAIGSCTSQPANSYASEGKHELEKKEAAAPAATNEGSGSLSGPCDQSLWNHVYDPTRLTVLNQCTTVTGTVAESNVDDDGDQHFLVKLDPGQDQLLTKKNIKKKNGDLVAEIVCANKVKIKKAKSACAGWSNPVPLPSVGAHVSVTGTFVNDTHNGWNEIHPVSSVK
ncbi:MAG: hypothetical protein ABR582_15730 [Gemmatimonadaceae bacterium]